MSENKTRVHKAERTMYSCKEACEYLQRAEITLKKWRHEGRGPKYSKDAHGRIWYSREDLDDFLCGASDAK